MNAITWWVVQTTLFTAALIPIVLLLCRFFRDRPSVQHALWAVVLIKFLTPSFITWPWSFDDAATVARGLADTLFDPPPPPSPSELVFPMMDASIPLTLPSTPAGPAVSPLNVALALLCVAWLAGACLYSLRQGRLIRRQASLVRAGHTPPCSFVEAVEDVAKIMSLSPPSAVSVRGILSPFIWCLGRLTLAWPDELLRGPTGPSSSSIIAHELAHIRRRDHWVGWLELIAGLLWWWNPCFWLVRRNLRATAEMACDALALAAFPAERCAYAETLLALSINRPHTASAVALGATSGSRSTFERRLSMIASERTSGRLTMAGAVIVGLLAAASLPAWSSGNNSPEHDPLPSWKAGDKTADREPSEIVLPEFKIAAAERQGPLPVDARKKKFVEQELLEAHLKALRDIDSQRADLLKQIEEIAVARGALLRDDQADHDDQLEELDHELQHLKKKMHLLDEKRNTSAHAEEPAGHGDPEPHAHMTELRAHIEELAALHNALVSHPESDPREIEKLETTIVEMQRKAEALRSAAKKHSLSAEELDHVKRMYMKDRGAAPKELQPEPQDLDAIDARQTELLMRLAELCAQAASDSKARDPERLHTGMNDLFKQLHLLEAKKQALLGNPEKAETEVDAVHR